MASTTDMFRTTLGETAYNALEVLAASSRPMSVWPAGVIETAQRTPSLAEAVPPNSERARLYASDGHKRRRSWNSWSSDRLSYGRPSSNTTSGRPEYAASWRSSH